MHTLQIASLDKVWFPAVANKQGGQFFVADSGQDSGVIDLVSIQMQDGQNSAVSDWVQEFGTVPASRKWTCLGFSITDHCQRDKVGVVKDGSEGVGDGISQFATFVDTSRSLNEQSLLAIPLSA
jgi:hypothetical protein